jgi:hypothetical protein
MTSKYREVVCRADVTLPALSTEQPERPYSFLNFLGEWVVGARGMRKDENLEHLFCWEETIEKFVVDLGAKCGIKPLPVGASKEDADAYLKAVNEASVGQSMLVPEEAFAAGKLAAKEALDGAGQPGGAISIPKLWEPKVLRHYHALIQSKAIT